MRRLHRLLAWHADGMLDRILLQRWRHVRPLEASGETRLPWVDRLAPLDRVLLVGKLEHRQLAELGIAKKLSAIVERAPIRFGDEMNGFCGVPSSFAKIEAFEDVERRDERDAAGRRRRGADDLVPSIRSAHGRAIDDIIVAQVVERDQSAACLHELRDLARHLARIEIIRGCSDTLERAGKLRLLEHIALVPTFAVVLKDALRVGKLRKSFVRAHRARSVPTERKPLARQANGRRHHLL